VGNIRELLWEEGVTTVQEYQLRVEFYGSLTKTGEGSMPLMDYKDEIGARADVMQETLTNTRLFFGGGDTKPQGFGWKEYYTRELRDYLVRGLESFDIYDD